MNSFDTETTQEKSRGFSGLFSKIMKEPDETDEELNNNALADIFKYRQGLQKDNGYSFAASATNNLDKSENESNSAENSFSPTFVSDLNSKYDTGTVKTINDDVIDKKVTLGDTLISSDTKEIDVNVVNDFIKDVTTEMLSTKFAEKQSTQIINTADVKTDTEFFDKTQIIDLEQEKLKQETVIAPEEGLNLNVTQNTVILNNNSEEIPESEDNKQENVGFASIAEKLVEAKLNLDNTQMIDTNKVREALKEANNIAPVVEYEDNPEFDEMYKKTFGVDPFNVRKEKELENLQKEKMNASNDFSYATENVSVFEDKAEECPEIPYKFLGIAFSTYIIVEIKNEMYIIDQHAAHERIMYEKVKANYYDEGERDEQFLLLPDVISLTHKEMIIAKENVDMFNRAGFSFEEFGENTIKLMSVPSMCEDMNTKQLFLDILDEIDTVAVTARQEKEDKFIATIACKAAVKAKMKLDEQEVAVLMARLLELPNPFTCPHGRPTAIKMTKTDLEKKFSRR